MFLYVGGWEGLRVVIWSLSAVLSFQSECDGGEAQTPVTFTGLKHFWMVSCERLNFGRKTPREGWLGRTKSRQTSAGTCFGQRRGGV